MQMVPAIALAVGAIFLPYSPRWLMLQDRQEESLATLAKLRGSSPESGVVQYEFRALLVERRSEKEAAIERYGTAQATWTTELLEYKRILSSRPLLRRLLLGAGVQALGQWTGINAVIYYAPTIFEQIGLSGGTIGLLATGVVGIVNFVFTIPAVIFIDNIGRRPMICWGEANMAISHAGIAGIVATYGNNFAQSRHAAYAAVFLTYWYIANYAASYGPVGWVVVSEVFPLHVRAKGIGLSSAINWIMNFAVAQATPPMLAHIGYKTFLVFMCCCIVGFLWAYFVLPELKGLSLEEIDLLFEDGDSALERERRARIAGEVEAQGSAAGVLDDVKAASEHV